MRLRDAAASSERSIIRLALYSGFGLVFALWGGSSLDTIRHIDDVRSRTEQVQEWFSSTELLLDDVRTGVLEASIDLRDALLDTTAPSNESYRQRLRRTKADVGAALDRYQPHAHSEAERADFNQMRRTIEEFWLAAEPILGLDESGRTGDALQAMRQQIVPRRESVRQISERIRRLNDSAAEDLRMAVESANVSMKRRAWFTGGLSLLLGLGVALVVTHRAARLEHQIRQETAKNAESVRALQRLSEQLVQAQEAERRRIARELHDEVGQSLTALKIELARQAGNSPEYGDGLDEAREIADQTLKNVRVLSRLLHPMVLEDLGLTAALEWYLGEFSKRTGIAADLAHTGIGDRFAPNVETCIYRIVQEATTNVSRHAAATSCRVTLQHDHNMLMLIVADDGRGCDVDAKPGDGAPRGLGLVSIRERVSGFGGKMQVSSAPGKGTTLTVELPVVAAQGADLAAVATR